MKNVPAKLWALLCAVFILNACQKEISTSKEEEVNNENQGMRNGGALPDDPAMVAKVPVIMSSEFYKLQNDALGARGSASLKKDSDADGIPNVSDVCPTQKETVNGYQDTDGCPDTVPTPTPTDTDADGIPDVSDACPTQKETVNGYKDTDGCPDTVPDTDADGIVDTQDACSTQKETVNGYQDTDGCPDTPPTVLPPTPIPASFQLVTPPVGNQGNEGACVPFAIAYAARSIEQYYRTNATSYSTASNIFSPEYVYNQTKLSDCATGSAPTIVLDLIKTQGVSTWASMPYSDVNGCSLLPSSTQLANAANYKIASYVMIPHTDRVAIKTMIASKHPVIITIIADNSFTNAGPGFIWKAYSGSGALRHSLIICGYDDTKNAYKVMNSWGTTWGDAGFSWIDYAFFPQKSTYDTYAIQ
jgi:C1A family cysteine protease